MRFEGEIKEAKKNDINEQHIRIACESLEAKGFDFSDTSFKSMDHQVSVVCQKHGQFQVLPKELFKGNPCPECLKDIAKRGQKTVKKEDKSIRKYTHEMYIKLLNERHAERYTFEKVHYTGARNKVIITCKVHGDFEVNASQFLNNEERYGCKHCRRENAKTNSVNRNNKRISNMISSDDFVKMLEEKYSDRYSFDKVVYTGSNKKMTVTCKAHGDVEVYTSAFFHNECFSGCPKCRKKPVVKKSPKKKLSELERFIKISNGNHFDRYDYTKVVLAGKDDYITVVCPAHGEFLARADYHKRGLEGCPDCKSNRAKHGKKFADAEFDRLVKIKEGK